MLDLKPISPPDDTTAPPAVQRVAAEQPACLSRGAAEVLRLLACLPRGAGLATLGALASKPDGVARALDEALGAGLVVRRDTRPDAVYGFATTALAQAAYQNIPLSQRAGLHLRIGRQLLAASADPDHPAALADILEQLNRGAAGMPMRAERVRCARLNLRAGLEERQRAAAEPAAALAYFAAAHGLLGGERWQHDYELSFALARQHAETLLLLGRYAEAEAGLAEMARRAASHADRGVAARLQMVLAAALDRPDRALAVAAAQLARGGLHLSLPANDEVAAAAIAQLWSDLDRGGLSAFNGLPLADPPQQARLAAMAGVLTLCLRVDQPLCLQMLARALQASRQQGYGAGSALAYVALGVAAGARDTDGTLTYFLGQHGLALARQPGLGHFGAAARLYFAQLLMPWHAPFEAAAPVLAGALQQALGDGDPLVATLARIAMIDLMMARGAPLPEVQQQIETALRQLHGGFSSAAQILGSRLALVGALRGTQAAGAAETPPPGQPLAARSHWVQALQARYHAGEFGAALRASAAAAPLATRSPPDLEHADYLFYSALAHAGAFDLATPEAQAGHRQALAELQAGLQRLVRHRPHNFSAMSAMLAAEGARLDGHQTATLQGYQQAIDAAAAAAQPQLEALAHELAARHYTAMSLPVAAAAHWQRAHQLYLRWGALGKARQLEGQQPAAGAVAAASPAAPNLVRLVRVTAMAEFAAAISHEVSQPLAAIVLNAGAGLQWLNHTPPDLAQLHTTLDAIATAGRRASEIVRSIRSLAHKSAPLLASVSLEQAIDEALEPLRPTLAQWDIRVTTRLAPERHQIQADRAQLRQLLTNLFANAIEALRPVDGRQRTLEVNTLPIDCGGACGLRLDIADNGVGLAAGAEEHLFDSFYSTHPDGMGMGLSICRAIVETHGGRIWCAGRQPHGTVFHVCLPPHGPA